MKKSENKLILRKNDFALLNEYLRNARSQRTFNKQEADDLQAELKKAKLVDNEHFPQDVVGLNSIVKIQSDSKSAAMILKIVIPEEANIKENKISIMAPIGTALIGFREGQKVKWKVPKGYNTFTILDVNNDHDILVS
ncbi:MAG: GreA/GreB family elongation factor [Chitinophagaceae bacterium]